MHKTDVAIVGGGLAGSLTAAMLGRAGIDCVLVDPNEVYPNDFRCEKLDGPQVEILKKTGLAEPVLRAATFDGMNWVARYGVVLERRAGDQHGIFYTPLVNTVRGEIPPHVRFIKGKAQAIATSADRQSVTLANGEAVDARLVLLANGLSVSLRDQLRLEREIVSRCHSITIGAASSAISTWTDGSRSGRSISTSRAVTCSRAWCSPVTLSRRHAPRQVQVRARC